MNRDLVDLCIIGAGPVGLMCAYLAQLCGLSTVIVDKSDGPLEVGRADALNARTLQLLEVVDIFDEVYPLGKPCNTSSIFKDGKFILRESSWWDELEGCFHKHFLMLGQSYLEKVLDRKLNDLNASVERSTSVTDIKLFSDICTTTLSGGDVVKSKYIIGADGSRSFVRSYFNIPFEIERPRIIWAVIDGVIDSDFPKVPEIIVFQAKTSDVAWIPREGKLDRFYVRMDIKEFSIEDVLKKINRAIKPYCLKFKEVVWFSQFSVKESVAESFFIKNRVFLAGDSCHIHSVNGGQGLNTGIADAFNLIWKLNMVIKNKSDKSLLGTYEKERKPVAQKVIESSGELVRSTKYSENNTHAKDYVDIIKRRSGNITGMGIEYEGRGLKGKRFFDFEVHVEGEKKRIYSLLSYDKMTLFVFSKKRTYFHIPDFINVKYINNEECEGYRHYANKMILVRPDAYIEAVSSVSNISVRNDSLGSWIV